MTESKYLNFIETTQELPQTDKRKTKVWLIESKIKNKLGWIKWFGSWRAYAFFPIEYTIYDKTCLMEIAKFIEERNIEHRENRKLPEFRKVDIHNWQQP